jgi:hypothetical protein
MIVPTRLFWPTTSPCSFLISQTPVLLRNPVHDLQIAGCMGREESRHHSAGLSAYALFPKGSASSKCAHFPFRLPHLSVFSPGLCSDPYVILALSPSPADFDFTFYRVSYVLLHGKILCV